MSSLPMSTRIDSLIENLVTEIGHIDVEVIPPRPDLDMRITTLRNQANPEDQVHIIELGPEIIVQFGHDLRLELEAKIPDVQKVEALLRALLFQGYTEEVRVRGNHVVQSKSVIEYNNHLHEMATRTLGGKWRSKKRTVIHKPWI